MKWPLVFSIVLFFATGIVRGQTYFTDSVEVTVIHFNVLPPLDKNGLPKKLDIPMEHFYYILWNNHVIIKELNADEWPEYRLFDLNNNQVMTCFYLEGEVVKMESVTHTVQEKGILIKSENQKMILGYPVYQCQVVNRKDTLNSWQTDIFNMNFSTIGQLPGVPLYYEKDWEGNKLRYVAREVYTHMLSSEFFDIENMKEMLK